MCTCKGQPGDSSRSQSAHLPDLGLLSIGPPQQPRFRHASTPRPVYISPLPLMPRSKSSAGVSTAVMTSQEEPIQRLRRPGYGTFQAQRQRRHSWHTKPCSQEAENFHLMVGTSRKNLLI